MAIYTEGEGKLQILDERFDLPHRNSVVAGWLHNANSASRCVPHPVKGQGDLRRG